MRYEAYLVPDTNYQVPGTWYLVRTTTAVAVDITDRILKTRPKKKMQAPEE